MRYILLDLIRIIAILLILIRHVLQVIHEPYGFHFGIKELYYVSIGGFGVTIFLILSGIVQELQDRYKNMSLFGFIWKKARRIYPVYHMALLIGVFIYFLKAYVHSGTVSAGLSGLKASDIFLSLTGFYSLAGQWGGPFIESSWFIGLILSMYLLYPFVSRPMRKNPHVTILALFVISALSRMAFGKYVILSGRPIDWFPLCRIFEFSLGIYFARIFRKEAWGILNTKNVALASVITFLGEISFPLFLIHHPLLFIINYLSHRGVSPFFAVCVFIMVSVLLSWAVLFIDKRVHHSRAIRNLAKAIRQVRRWFGLTTTPGQTDITWRI